MPTVNELQKQVRAEVIRAHIEAMGNPPVVCLTCGNAAEALRCAGLRVVELGPRGWLLPQRWLSATDVASLFPGHFDATSGHLSMPLMLEIARQLAIRLPVWELPLHVPAGSGETYVCLRLAFPHSRIFPEYGTDGPLAYHPEAPLNALVKALTPGS